MKKMRFLFSLIPVIALIGSVQAEVPAATTPSAPAPSVAPDASASAPAADAPVDPAKVVEIRKLLELTGTVKITQQVMGQMISQFKSQNSSVSNEFWDRFEKEMDIEGLVDKMIPIYAKYYTLDDLKTVNAFYETPTGQRVLAATPQIMQESMGIGQSWGRDIVAKLLAELKEEKEKQKSQADKASAPPAPASGASAAPSPN
jgi:hypothetical protein